jgi:hypothetical protein
MNKQEILHEPEAVTSEVQEMRNALSMQWAKYIKEQEAADADVDDLAARIAEVEVENCNTIAQVLLAVFLKHIKETGDTSCVLPVMTTIKGEAFSLVEFPMFVPLFNIYNEAKTVTYQCSRQVGKTESMNASQCIKAALVPNYHVLIVAPRYAQAVMIAKEKMMPMIKGSEEALIPNMISEDNRSYSASELRTRQGNVVTYMGCYHNPDGARGQAKDVVCFDETQDMNPAHIPVVSSCADGSLYYSIIMFFGTPKGTHNLLTRKFTEGSQGFWCVPCRNCDHHNWANDDPDPEDPEKYVCEHIIGTKGPICLKCKNALTYDDVITRGYIKYRFPERNHKRTDPDTGATTLAHTSVHVNQIFHPVHISSEAKYAALYAAKMGGMDRVTYVNEKLGFAKDRGNVLITPAELYRNCKDDESWDNTLGHARTMGKAGIYDTYLSFDWSGFGDDSSVSYTTAVFFRHRRGDYNKFEVLYMERFDKSMGIESTIAHAANLARTLNPKYIAHDQGGAGFHFEALMRMYTNLNKRLIGISYNGNNLSRETMFATKEDAKRQGFILVKARSLEMLYCMIKGGYIDFPYRSEQVDDTMSDFLNLERESKFSDDRSDSYSVKKKEGLPDDVVHALNFGINLCLKIGNVYPQTYEDILGTAFTTQ